jgi:hypothetical protein
MFQIYNKKTQAAKFMWRIAATEMKWKKIRLCKNQKEQNFFFPSESEIANNEWGMGDM